MRNNIVSGVDILPTICAACGLPIPENIDGIDINEILTGYNFKSPDFIRAFNLYYKLLNYPK